MDSEALAVMERLDADAAQVADGHRFRYHLAAGFCWGGDVVLDAACGAGYGRDILQRTRPGSPIFTPHEEEQIHYFGVDVEPPDGGCFVAADLRTWVSDIGFDVFVGFETIEHLTDYTHYVAHAKQARRWIIVSVPVVPTTHLNPYHCHNFAPGQLASLFIDENWRLFQSVLQPSELSEIYVFARR